VTGYRTARRLLGADLQLLRRRIRILGLAQTVSGSRKISEFSTSRSAIAVAMVLLKRMLPQSENALFVVIM
jgi:hypothetical protein